ncbi:mitochondrial protein C2orf69 homolog isoform X3 [Daphnia pulicaria]|uniref:mitochondrial protein C2orf69 homolog isoform X3 n=1 Tax=Daphnia pulicaria TaxID=35523 RepID=UPI001EEC7995|nr:mitochondrial protein C2orf69 homolog isoform X3 [Daphnia pulicaria]
MAPNLQRLVAVTGYNERVNDVIFVERQISTDPASVVVFFGGDVQDYPENMKSHRDHGAYVEYNLEAVAEILASKFKSSFICVIRPAKPYSFA